MVPDTLPAGWRRHARAAHLDLFRRWMGDTAPGLWLKTDLQEERSTARSLIPHLGGAWRGIDVSEGVVARARMSNLLGVNADVRRLPFASETFDGVLSTSTLDHFHRVEDIDVALRELHRVVRPVARWF